MSSQGKATAQYYIGLMSGTSADGIDLALVDFSSTDNAPRLVASFYQDYSNILVKKITSLYQPGHNEVDRAFHLDIELAHLFAQAINALLKQEALDPNDIVAIGSHGQTIRHRPEQDNPYTLQIGCCQTLATLTGIRVVGQFRRKDMALGGQGAPLVPIFHQQLLHRLNEATFVVNIGGIANITFLPEEGTNQSVLGFDTGPGNALLDDWFIKHHCHHDEKFDNDGAWAAKGRVNTLLLNQLMSDDYITLSAPKSTGREYFHLAWLEQQLVAFSNSNFIGKTNTAMLSPVDVQATLLAFTAQSISHAIVKLTGKGMIYLCGGGAHNSALVKAIDMQLNNINKNFEVKTMQAVGVDGDILEAMAFSWFAYAFDHGLPSNLPAVTGAKKSCTLGSDFHP